MKMKKSKLDIEKREELFQKMQERCDEAIVYLARPTDDMIVDNVTNVDDSLVITLKDAGLPMDEREYTLYLNEALIAYQVDIITICQCEDGCNIVTFSVLSDEMEQLTVKEIHMTGWQFMEFKANDMLDEFNIDIVTRPPWSVIRSKDSSIIDIFPATEHLTAIGFDRKYGAVYRTIITAHLSPLDMKNVKYATIITPVTKGAALHDAKVLETLSELRTIESINIVPKSHIIENYEDNVGIYEIDYIDREGNIGVHMINDHEDDIIPIASLIDDRYTVLPEYKTIFASWQHGCPILCGSKIESTHYESVNISIETIMDALDAWEKLDRDAVDILAANREAGKRIYPSRNNTCKQLKKTGQMLVSARYALEKLMYICGDDQVNIYIEDRRNLYVITPSNIETPINILARFQEDMDIDFGV